MTLRIKYDDIFRTWNVEYMVQYCAEKIVWHTCETYYPKEKKNIYASFRTKEEAEEFMEWKYEDAAMRDEAWINWKPSEVPADYYNGCSRYYGD